MRPQSALFRYQRSIVQAVLDKPKTSVFVPVGYGKTAVVLTALQEMNLWPVLVVAPERVARKVWTAEAGEWAHLRNLQVTHLGGGDSRREKLSEDAHVETVSYEALVGRYEGARQFTGLTDEVDLDKRYKVIVFDELSKLKAAGTARFRRMRARCMKIPRRIGLTGTPIGNHLLDLWGEMFMVAGEAPLGPTFSGFRDRYFKAEDYYQRNWQVAHPSYEKEIHRRVAPWTFVLPPQPEVKIPPVVTNRITVEMPASVVKLGEKLERELFVALASGTEIEALSASTVAGKLRQFASGAVYTENGGEAWEPVHTEKLDCLSEVVDELQGEPLLVFFHYRHETQRIKARFGKRAVTLDEPGAMERWNRREVEILLAHPQSAGHGLNLQHGGSTIFWFTLPWSHELWVQANGRLARTGQKASHVMAHVPLCGEVDRMVLEALAGKGATERRLLDTLLAA